MLYFKRSKWDNLKKTSGQKDGETLIHGTLLAKAGCPIKQSKDQKKRCHCLKLSSWNYFHKSYYQEIFAWRNFSRWRLSVKCLDLRGTQTFSDSRSKYLNCHHDCHKTWVKFTYKTQVENETSSSIYFQILLDLFCCKRFVFMIWACFLSDIAIFL